MNGRRFPIGVLAIVPVVIGMGVWAFTGQAQVEDPAAQGTATANAAASLTPEPTATAEWWIDSPPQWTPGPTETPWPTPQASHGAFHDGAWVRIDAGEGDCLNARNTPSLQREWTIVNVCLPDGFEGLISGTTQEAEGHWWWYLAGLGFVAEDFLTYVGEFDARSNTLPELGGKGRVAFLRGNDIWLMNADGSDQRELVNLPGDEPGRYEPPPTGLAWSPDGRYLSYTYSRITDDPNGGPPGVELRVRSIADGSERAFQGLSGSSWSADGRSIGVVREPVPGGVGGGDEGVPAILDVETGGQLVLGSEPFWQETWPSFNHDGSMLMVLRYKYNDETQAEDRAIIIYDTTGLELQRITFDSSTYFASPRWSPTANRIAMHLQDSVGRARYAVYDVASASFVGEGETPRISDRVGGRCGGGSMWSSAWTDDGRSVLYSFDLGDTGSNGIWVWDTETGGQRVITAASAMAPASGPDGSVMFSAWSGDKQFIFVGTTAGGLPRILTDGSSPVWHYAR